LLAALPSSPREACELGCDSYRRHLKLSFVFPTVDTLELVLKRTWGEKMLAAAWIGMSTQLIADPLGAPVACGHSVLL
jgi:hypothetical protein